MSRRSKRNRFARWFRSLFFSRPLKQRSVRAARFESLEGRQLMAVDSWSPLLGSASRQAEGEGIGSSVELRAEGEDVADLAAFAKALADSGTSFFGAFWCPHCLEQKNLFQDGAKFLPYVEVTNPDRTPNSIATSEGITQYPTWEFPDGSRLTGVQTLQTLSQRSGVAIPQSSRPSFETIADVTVGTGSPLHIPVDAYDPNGNPLTISVTSSNPNLLTAQVLNGNRSVRMSVQNFGDMVFELFEDKAPRATSRVIELAQSGFYNKTASNEITFHRVINNFVIQAGDPTGTGAGGSTLGDFDDHFHVDLQHNRTGVLSFAKAGDDTNDSQFFITEGPQRFLDFNHSVFGQLVEGEKVREAISNVATNASDKPTVPIVYDSMTVFDDVENGIVILKPTGSGTGTADITVTVTDSEGNSSSQTFRATVANDTANGGPFLNDFQNVQTSVNTPVNVTLTSQDVEGDPVSYSVQKIGQENYTVSVNNSTGVATVTPPQNFVGQFQFRASVSQTTSTTTNDKTDSQLITVVVAPTVPTSIDLNADSDSGASNSDNITNAQTLSFTVGGTISGATVQVKAGNTVIGSAVASGSTTTVVANNVSGLGQGAILIVANQIAGGQTSGDSPNLSVTLDNQSPVALAAGSIPATAQINQALSLNLAHAEEGQGLVYALQNGPTGMTLNSATGQLDWTPTTAQVGANTFSVSLTDSAGNARTDQFTVTVSEQPKLRVSLLAVNSQGSPITQVATGDTFKVRVLVEDLRGFAATGVFATYVDVLFDPNIIEPIATNPIAHPDPYTNDQKGSTTTPGLIDELGGFSATTTRLGADPRILAEITFTAKASGNPNLRTEAPDVFGNDILLFDETSAVPFSRVTFGSNNLVVGANFQVVNDVFNFDEDSGVRTLSVLTNDTTSNGVTLTVSAVGTPSGGGTVSIAPGGTTLSYTSKANFNGAESFTYTARNQNGVELTGTVTVQITDVNDPPVATNDVFTVAENSTANVLQVLLNDNSGVDTGETLTVSSVSTGSAEGGIQLGSSGLNILYSPKLNFKGTETFTYTLSDGRGGSATGTVSVNVAVANPPPVAGNDEFTVVEDAVPANFNVLANDTTDNPAETLSISAVGTSTNGSALSISSDSKQLIYRPGANFAGQEKVTYTLRDSGGATTTGTVTFTVTAVNDPPEANDDSLSLLSSNSSQSLNVLANDRSVDAGENLTITALTQPASGTGTVTIATDGKSILYSGPSNTFEGTVSFTYTVSDGTTLTDAATVTLKVNNFTPRDIGGQFIAGSALEFQLGGVELDLSGTDYLGNAVTRTTTANSDGTFAYADLPPGSYTINRDPLPFLHDSAQTVQIVSAFTDGDNLSNRSQVGGLRPKYFGIRDFLGSAARNNLTVAVPLGGNQQWLAPRGDWSGFRNLTAQLNAAGDSLTLNAVNASNQNVRATLPIGGTTSRVTQHGQESGLRLLRVAGSASQVGFQPVTSTSSTQPAGEGEGPSDSPMLAQDTHPQVTGAGLSSQPVSSVVPVSILSPTQSIRQLLGSASRSLNGPSGNHEALDAESVDSAMSQVSSKLNLKLSNDLVDSLTSSSDDAAASIDRVLGAM